MGGANRLGVRLPGTGRLERWDTFSGEVEAVAGRAREGGTEIALSLPAVGSQLLVMDTDRPAVDVQPESPPAWESKKLSEHWAFHRLDPNALTLDYCTLSLEGGPWGERRPAWRCAREAEVAGVGTSFRLRFRFQAEVMPASIELVLDYPEQVRIEVNGQSVPCQEKAYWRDINFQRVDIGRHVQEGDNEIELAGVVREDTDLGEVFLIGDFGVTARRIGPERHRVKGMDFDRYGGEFTLGEEAGEGNSRDLNEQGYPFFAGTLSLRQTVEVDEPGKRALLALDGLHAIVAEVWVNGQQAGNILVPPHQVEVSGLLRAGANEIELRLVTSLRNLLGPLHLPGGEGIWTGADEFTDKKGWTDDYIFVPFGFEGARLLRERE